MANDDAGRTAAAAVVFPLLIWLILRQREIANLFTRTHGGGFEVVPLAQTAHDHITPPRP